MSKNTSATGTRFVQVNEVLRAIKMKTESYDWGVEHLHFDGQWPYGTFTNATLDWKRLCIVLDNIEAQYDLSSNVDSSYAPVSEARIISSVFYSIISSTIPTNSC